MKTIIEGDLAVFLENENTRFSTVAKLKEHLSELLKAVRPEDDLGHTAKQFMRACIQSCENLTDQQLAQFYNN